MSSFILIDHSLKGVGGHHFEYAAHILAAAERAGYRLVLATNRKFKPGVGYREHWAARPIFRYSTYSKFTLYRSRATSLAIGPSAVPGAAPPTRYSGHGGVLKRLCQFVADSMHARGRQRRIASFARGLGRLFAAEPLADGDQVFIPTLSELDLAGLVRYLKADAHSQRATWHLQFHYNIFEGREPDYAAQHDRLVWMQSAFRAALAEIPSHRVRFYNTTAQLAAQYERMGLAAFHALPYPVNETLTKNPPPVGSNAARLAVQGESPLESSRPLRVTSLGAIRPEKGSRELANVVRELWDTHFLPGRMQLVVQSNKRRFRLPLPVDHPDQLPAGVEPVVYAPHPLAMDAYVDLIRRADVGLLMYDSARYYARCSGVLVELLSVGVPVIVTAGCWMAEQLAEANFVHADEAARTMRRMAEHDLVTSHVGARLGIASGDVDRRQFNLPRGATHAFVSFVWREPQTRGVYLRATVETQDIAGQTRAELVHIVGRREGANPIARALFPLPPDASTVTLSLASAYDPSAIVLDEARLEFHSAFDLPGGSYPLGAVGLIAADHNQVGKLLADIAAHYNHYRASAIAFSHAWSAYHNADRIVAELTRGQEATTANTRRTAA